ncbi:hypothetical protein KQI84_18560 [bacterium]|nr:hypothetical protein [bacterium]
MSNEERFTAEEWHRRLAVSLFNETWTYIEKPDRTPAETDRMIHMAHASRYHWEQVGKPINLGRGEWQVSRVHAISGHADTAIYHGMRYLQILEENGIGDWDVAAACEAIARGYMVAGDSEKTTEYLAKAREACKNIKDSDDLKVIEKDLETIQVP